MRKNMISRGITTVLMLLAVATMSAQPMRMAESENTRFSLFFNDGEKTQFGVYSGIQFYKEGDRYTWSLTGDDEGDRHDIADFVAPVRLLTEPAPELTTQTLIDHALEMTPLMAKVDGGNLQCDHNVWMDHDFAIGQTEVTQALWQSVMGENPSSMVGDNLPVNNVSCDNCQTFIAKLNELTGRTFSLPTEAEWLFAARGGTISEGYKYAGSNTLGDVAWYKNNSSGTVHEVATLAPNELGIYDMQGNIIEFCQDLNANGMCIFIGGAYSVENTSKIRYFSWTFSGQTATDNANAGYGLRLVLR